MMMMEHSAIDLSNRVRAVICPCPFYWVQQSSVYRVYLGRYVYGRQTTASFGDLDDAGLGTSPKCRTEL